MEGQDIKEEDMFKVEKHVHTVNIEEAGDYLVAMRWYMEAFAKIMRRGKSNVSREYKKLICFAKLMVEKLGADSPIEAGDIDTVYETIVDPQCIAWRRAQHGTKTGKSKGIQRVEEKWWKVERSIEERELMSEEEVQMFVDTMQVKRKSDKADMVIMIKMYFGHVAKAHEEAASAAKLAQLLIDEVNANSYMQLIAHSTRPLIMLEVSEMVKQVAGMKMDCES